MSLNTYLYSDSVRRPKQNTTNPFAKTAISVWHESQVELGVTPVLSQLFPIWGNAMFTPGKSDSGFKLWWQKSIQKIADLYAENIMMSFEILRERHKIPQSHFFKFLQIGNFM